MENQNLSNAIKSISNILKDSKQKRVLTLRKNGSTLDEIGATLGVTRERVRQIEIKPKKQIIDILTRNQTALIENMFIDGIMDESKILEILDIEDLEVLKYIVHTGNADELKISVSPELSLIIVDNTSALKKFTKQIVDSIKKTGGDVKKDFITPMNEAGYGFVTNKNATEFLIYHQIKSYNNKMFYGKITIAKAIAMAIHDFDDKKVVISDQESLQSFADILNNVYGLDVKPNRALATRIQDILVMVDKATYTTIDSFVYDEETLDSIINFVEKDCTTKMSYTSLFNRFEEELSSKTNIVNESMLHGILKHYESDNKYKCLRCYISPDEQQETSGEYFKSFAELLYKNGPMSESEILEAFPDWSPIYIKYAMTYYKEIVQWDKKVYNNIKRIKISETNKKIIKDTIESLSSNEYHYTSSYNVYEEVKKVIDLDSAGIKSDKHLFYYCKHFMADDYKYRRPHIYSNNAYEEASITTDALVQSMVSNKDIIDKKEFLAEISKAYGSKNSSLSLSMQRLLSGYIRISADSYIKKEKFKIQKSTLSAISCVLDNLCVDGIVDVAAIKDFSVFPKISVEWNSWVLCGIVDSFNTGYEKENKSNTKSKHVVSNLVKK